MPAAVLQTTSKPIQRRYRADLMFVARCQRSSGSKAEKVCEGHGMEVGSSATDLDHACIDTQSPVLDTGMKLAIGPRDA